jgi:hypothetical protein
MIKSVVSSTSASASSVIGVVIVVVVVAKRFILIIIWLRDINISNSLTDIYADIHRRSILLSFSKATRTTLPATRL